MFKILDTARGNRVVLAGLSEIEAHRRVDLLNSCGIVRYKARRA